MNLQTFIEYLQKSGLLEPAGIQQALAAYRSQTQTDAQAGSVEARRFADDLVQQQRITEWHRDKLLNGKYRGFFLGKYKLLGHLGTGGMSSVYLAEHRLMRQQRAIKVLPRKRTDDPAYLERFYLEARATASLRHPNIVQAYDIDCEDNTHFIVMEYVQGRDLNAIVKEQGPLTFELAANYTAQAALGLDHAHETGLVHRDVKPGNLLVDEEGVVKVLDLGLALMPLDEDEVSPRDERVLGTADYLAPEQASNSHQVTGRADLYSLGCTLYFFLTGHAPFPEGTIAARIRAHQRSEPEPIRASRPECPTELLEICGKLMRKDPAQRFATGMEVATALDGWLIRNGYARVVTPKVRRRKPQGVGTRSGQAGPLDEAASSSARLLMGLDEGAARERKKRGDSEEPPPKTDSVHDSLSETLSGLSSLKESDQESELPRIDVQTRDSRARSSSGSSRGLPVSQSTAEQSPDRKAARESAAPRERGRPRDAVQRLRRPDEISLDGLAELEAGSPASVADPKSIPRMTNRPAISAARKVPAWVWALLAGGALLLLILAIVLGIVLAGGEPEPSLRESTAWNAVDNALTGRGLARGEGSSAGAGRVSQAGGPSLASWFSQDPPPLSVKRPSCA